jgi:hypothetical protein
VQVRKKFLSISFFEPLKKLVIAQESTITTGSFITKGTPKEQRTKAPKENMEYITELFRKTGLTKKPSATTGTSTSQEMSRTGSADVTFEKPTFSHLKRSRSAEDIRKRTNREHEEGRDRAFHQTRTSSNIFF